MIAIALDGGALQTFRSRLRSCATAPFVVSHVANIFMHLVSGQPCAEGRSAAASSPATGLQLTITDFVSEVHDTHHPISTNALFRGPGEGGQGALYRLPSGPRPEISRLFRARARRQPGGTKACRRRRPHHRRPVAVPDLGGERLCLPARPRRRGKAIPRWPRLTKSVAAHAKVAAYLASDRRIPFNTSGIFRHYPELDTGPAKARKRKS